MKRSFVSLILLALIFAGGCLQSTTVVEVEKDGSGRVMIREFYSPQVTQMLEGMAGMMAGKTDAQGSGEMAAAGDPKSMFDKAIQGRIEKMGPGVTLDSSKEVTNAQGWKGYTAVYSFKDINDICVAVGDNDMGGQPGMMGQSVEDEEVEDGAGYQFRFTPGEIAKLEVLAPNDDMDEGESSEENEMPAEMEDTTGAMGDMNAEMMMGMMKPMLKGMRMSLLIKVKGKITDTNSSFVSEDHPDMITVMDLAMDPLLNNPEAMKVLMEGKDDPKAVYKLQALGLKGAKIEEPGKSISISFK